MATSIRQRNSSTLALVQADAGRPKAWSDVLKHYAVDEVVAVSAWEHPAALNELANACAERGVIFRQLVTMPKPAIGTYHIDDAGNGSYFVSLETVPQDYFRLAVKRVDRYRRRDAGRVAIRDRLPLLRRVAADDFAGTHTLPSGTPRAQWALFHPA